MAHLIFANGGQSPPYMMAQDSERSSNESPVLDYAHARPPGPPTMAEWREQLDRRERVAAFCVLGVVVGLPFLVVIVVLLGVFLR